LIIHESAENYLETILVLEQELGSVRSIDIVNELEYTRPSVSVAMKKLRESGYITIDGNGSITLTNSGREIAERMYERHKLLTSFLVSIGVDDKTAGDDACRIEHVISQQTFEKINEFTRRKH
jgi:Mn-dependent DtxR family transcriptional regulator